MPKKKQRRKIHKSKTSRNYTIHISLGLLAIVLIVFLAGLFIINQFKPIIETPKSEVKKLPSNIETQLRNTTVHATFRVPILLYHYVEYVQDKKDTIRQSLNITPNVFEEQIKTLSDAGYTFMTAKDMAQVIDGQMSLPKNPVILTFDDGHWDLDTNVLPILEKYHAKATAYIISGFIGGSDFLSTAQLQNVIDSGLVEVGAHTVHHISLKGKLLPVVQYEVNQSKLDLQKKYHIPVVSFAYPGGAFDSQAARVVESAGFKSAVSTVPGVAQTNGNRYFLFRLRPGYRTGQSLIDYLQGTSFSEFGGVKN